MARSTAIFALCFALSYLEGEALGWVMGMSIGVIALLVLLAWPLRREGWFWALVAAFVAIHAAAAFGLDWSWVEHKGTG